MDVRAGSEFYLTLSRSGEDFFHAGRTTIASGGGYPGQYLTLCGHTWEPAPVTERIGHVTCPACVAKLYGPTITGLVDLITDVNTINGWRGDKGELLTPDHPMRQLAALSKVAIPLAWVAEAIRKPWDYALETRLNQLTYEAGAIATVAVGHFSLIPEEDGGPVYGSKTAAVARTRLFDTESVELTEAIMDDDVAQIEDELADCLIRPLDFAGAWNDEHPDRPLDIQRGVLRKLEKNRTRGYKHGGKTA